MAKPTVAPQSVMATYQRIYHYAKPYWKIGVVAIISNLLFGMFDVQLIAGLEPLIDKGFGAKGPIDQLWLDRLPFYVLLFVVLRAVFAFVSEYTISYVGRMMVQDLRQELFDHYLRVPAQFYDQHTTGQITSTITFNAERLANTTMDVVKEFIRDGAQIIYGIVMMFVISWKLTLVFITVGPIIGLVLRVASKRFRKISKNLQNSMGSVTHVSNESIQGYRVVRAFGGQHYESTRFRHAAENNRRQHIKLVATKAGSVGVVQLCVGVALAMVIGFAANQISHGSISPGEFSAVAAIMLGLLKPFKALSQLSAQMSQGVAAAQSIFEVLDSEPESNHGTHTVKRAQGRLKFDAVGFTYSGASEPAMRDVELTIEQGKTIALVGKSGSGKSTIASLLLRFYDVQDGRILLDDVDIRSYELDNYREQFAIVSQHVTLFNDTIAANIAYGSQRHRSRDEIEAAAKLAQAWEFIQEAENGLDTMVGDNGLTLSGGQRQRLAIARAILKDAPVLILDEATSALDNQSERLIQTALDELMKNRTTIVIAHRLSTIERADLIVVIDRGQIIEQGTHVELLQRNGEYARLHSAQFSE